MGKEIRIITGCMSISCVLRKMEPNIAFVIERSTDYSMGYIDFNNAKLKYIETNGDVNLYELVERGW